MHRTVHVFVSIPVYNYGFGLIKTCSNKSIVCFWLDIVQIFDNSAASVEGSLAAGDEIIGVNNKSVKNYTKVQVAKLIQSAKVCEARGNSTPLTV